MNTLTEKARVKVVKVKAIRMVKVKVAQNFPPRKRKRFVTRSKKQWSVPHRPQVLVKSQQVLHE